MPVFLRNTKKLWPVTIDLPSSKSESNRALIINALAGAGAPVANLSTARDTQTMTRLLESPDKELNVLDAGTTMRFLIAYLAATRQNKILTGTSRMLERPVGILVEALRELGAEIRYLGKQGYPPIETLSFDRQLRDLIRIRGDVSSQYISALLMIAPVLPKGLTLELTGHIGSRPYIRMTLDIMSHFGIRSDWRDNRIVIPHQTYIPTPLVISPDWSSASYWFSLVAMAEEAEITLSGLTSKSCQGDHVITGIMDSFGVSAEFFSDGLILRKGNTGSISTWDFSDCPDLAQTVAVAAAGLGMDYTFTGIESLRIKETDRISALQRELKKIGSDFSEMEPGIWVISSSRRAGFPSHIEFNTYEDHRMAMALAPLVTRCHLTIDDPGTVNKSYPGFWSDLAKAGIGIEYA